MEEDLKRMLQEEMEREAEEIMAEVNSDPSMADVHAPDSVREKLFAQIREYEEEKRQSVFTEEEKELIQLGRVYKKRKRIQRVAIIIAAAVAVLGIGVTSMGGPKRVFESMKAILAGREVDLIDTDGEQITEYDGLTEDEAYEKIEEVFNVNPVRMHYLPENMMFQEAHVDTNLQTVLLIYERKSGLGTVSYNMIFKNRMGSFGTDMEDLPVSEEKRTVQGVELTIRKIFVADGEEYRWKIQFEYENVTYNLIASDIEEKEVEKIIENLYFS